MTSFAANIPTPLGLIHRVVWAPISATGPAVATIAANAGPGQSLLVLGYLLIASGNCVALTFESSGGTILSGPYTHAAQSGNVAPFSQSGHFPVPKGEDLQLGISDAISVGGHIIYGVIQKG